MTRGFAKVRGELAPIVLRNRFTRLLKVMALKKLVALPAAP